MSDNTPHTHIFVAYASKDQEAHDTLCAHLNVLKKEIPITIWSAANLMPGTKIEEDTQAELQRADIVLLLVSTDSLNSEAYDNIQSQVQNATTFVPVLLRPCMWESDPFLKNLQPLPKNRQFISTSENQEEVYKDIAEEVKKMVVGESEDTFPSTSKKKPYLWVVAALAVILLIVLVLVWYNSNTPNATEDTTAKPIFSTTDTTFKVLILRFEDYISKKETECIGLSIKKLLKDLRDNEGMPLNPVYENSILSPEDLDSVKYLQKYHNADLLLYGLANQIKPECTGANVCFRRFVADTIMMNIGVPMDVNKIKHDLEYEFASPFDIEQGKLSVDNQSMEAWIKALIALKEGNTEIYLFEIENMVGDLSGLTDKEKAIKYFNQGKVYYSSKEYEKAILSFDKTLELNPNDIKSLKLKGNCYHDSYNYEKALEIYDEVIKIRPNDAVAYANIGDNLRHLGEARKSLKYLNKSVQLNPDDVNTYRYRAFSYSDLGEYNKAISDFDKLIEVKPNSSAYKSRGIFYLNSGDYEKAILDFNKVVEVKPKDATVYYNRGTSYLKNREYNKAILDFNKAIELKPDDSEIYYNRGNTYLKSKDYEKAISDYDVAIKLDPKFAKAYSNRGNAYRDSGDYEKAISSFNKATELQPNLFQAYYNVGNTYKKMQNYDKAILNYDKAIKINPDFDHAYFHRGSAFLQTEEYRKAISDYNTLIKLVPTEVGAYINRGIAYDELKEYEKAILDYNKAMELNPDSYGEVLNKKGFACINLGDYQNAIESFSKLIERQSHAYSYNNRSYAYLKQNQLQKSQKDLQKSQKLDPKNSWLYRNWSIYHTTQNDFPKAIQNLKKAIELGYDDKEFLQEEELLAPLRSHPEFQQILDNIDGKNSKK